MRGTSPRNPGAALITPTPLIPGRGKVRDTPRGGFILAAFFALGLGGFLPAGDMDFLSWRQLGQRRERDGGVTADFELLGAEEAEEVEVFYRSFPFGLPVDGKIETWKPEVFGKKIGPGTRTLGIYGSRYEAVVLWARLVRDGRVMVAQIGTNLFGEGEPRETDFRPLEEPPSLPRVEIYRFQDVANPDAESIEQLGVDSAHAYAYSVMQSGETALIRLAGTGAEVPETLRVYEGETFSAELAGDKGIFTYTFPDYPDLADSSLFAWKDVCLAFESPALVVSCSIAVYRALYGHTNLPGGIAILLGVIAVSAALVLAAGRRVRA